jgi:hypothetical protein
MVESLCDKIRSKREEEGAENWKLFLPIPKVECEQLRCVGKEWAGRPEGSLKGVPTRVLKSSSLPAQARYRKGLTKFLCERPASFER